MANETAETQLTPSLKTYAAVFLTTLATLAFEILLTRILSVTIGYNLAFVAISLAMFGMTIGALKVYRNGRMYEAGKAKTQMTRTALWLAVTVAACLAFHFIAPFPSQPLIAALWIVAVGYPLFSIPFYFSGICVCIALTKFPEHTGALYAVDLAGAASGCILVIGVLKISDAATALIVVALLASIAGVLLAIDSGQALLEKAAIMLSIALLIFASVSTVLAHNQTPLFRVKWAKGYVQARPIYEKWNSFSRIAVGGDPAVTTDVLTEGMSATYPPGHKVRQLALRIDADAETTLTAFDGHFDDLEYLKYDVKSVVYYIRPHATAMVIGAGGGRDVLSALLFGAQSVQAVEINKDILGTVNDRFGGFTGHLNRNSRVAFVNDEARSYITRTADRFDVIQASFIDTWAATAAGALSCTENSIYTVEAWKLFLNRLTPSGVLSFSRWYQAALPSEAYRLTSLAAAALRAVGATDPRAHILVVRNLRRDQEFHGEIGAVTILVGKSPFSLAELDEIESVSKRMQFDVLLSPRFASEPVYADLATGEAASTVSNKMRVNVAPPTDNRPFFFYMTLPSESLNPESLVAPGGIVGALLLLVVFLSVFFIIWPVLKSLPRGNRLEATPWLVFFAAIGLAYMLIEISILQRLVIFLGHPVYTLSVVLFVLLLSSGSGSYATQRIQPGARYAFVCLSLLLAVVFSFGLFLPHLLNVFVSQKTLIRIAVSAGILIPTGFFMGMAFPLGMRLSNRRFESFAAGLWGINGAASVFASVLAVMIAMNVGISSSFWIGFSFYAVAFCAYLWASKTDSIAALAGIPVERRTPVSPR
jgi:hypothetical protein